MVGKVGLVPIIRCPFICCVAQSNWLSVTPTRWCSVNTSHSSFYSKQPRAMHILQQNKVSNLSLLISLFAVSTRYHIDHSYFSHQHNSSLFSYYEIILEKFLIDLMVRPSSAPLKRSRLCMTLALHLDPHTVYRSDPINSKRFVSRYPAYQSTGKAPRGQLFA